MYVTDFLSNKKLKKKTRLASNEIFYPSNKIHWEVGRAKDLSAPLYNIHRVSLYNAKFQWGNLQEGDHLKT